MVEFFLQDPAGSARFVEKLGLRALPIDKNPSTPKLSGDYDLMMRSSTALRVKSGITTALRGDMV